MWDVLRQTRCETGFRGGRDVQAEAACRILREHGRAQGSVTESKSNEARQQRGKERSAR